MENKKLLRAKLIDEPCVRMIFQDKYEKYFSNFDFVLPGHSDDWKHSDIYIQKADTKEIIYSFDVKRCESKYYNSSNFTLPNKQIDFKENSYYIFIDEVEWKLIIVQSLIIKNIINKYKSNKTYVIIPKSDLYSNKFSEILIDNKYKSFLIRNRDEELF